MRPTFHSLKSAWERKQPIETEVTRFRHPRAQVIDGKTRCPSCGAASKDPTILDMLPCTDQDAGIFTERESIDVKEVVDSASHIPPDYPRLGDIWYEIPTNTVWMFTSFNFKGEIIKPEWINLLSREIRPHHGGTSGERHPDLINISHVELVSDEFLTGKSSRLPFSQDPLVVMQAHAVAKMTVGLHQDSIIPIKPIVVEMEHDISINSTRFVATAQARKILLPSKLKAFSV